MLCKRTFSHLAIDLVCVLMVGLILVILANPVGAEENATLVEGARKEGKVVYYSGMTIEDAQAISNAFQKKYPFIKVEILRMSGEKILIKALTEARSKKLPADIFQTSIIQVSQMQENKLLMKYDSPESKAYPENFKSREGYWNAIYVLPYVLTYNTKIFPRDQAPKSYEDLLNPKWKGQIGMDAEEIQWYFFMMKVMGKDKGMAYMQKLAQQNVSLRKGHTLLVTLCAAGEVPVVTVGYLDRVERLRDGGAPIDWVRFKSSPVPTAINATAIVASAPHPNAAKLFHNFIISREGARAIKSVGRFPAHPEELSSELKSLSLYPLMPEELLPNYSQVEKEFIQTFQYRK